MINPKFTVASVASIAAAGLFMGGVAAHAADLGGNCCADLEERVAELEATTARKGNRKMSLEISGHLNEAIVWSDGDHAVVNNTNSSGRFRLKGSAKINGDVSAGFLIEIGVDHNVAADHGIAAAFSGGGIVALTPDHQLTIRHQAGYIQSSKLGTIWLGLTKTATEDITAIGLGEIVGSTLFSATALGVDAGMDGRRADGILYVSPNIGGFELSAGWQDDDAYDAALRFANEFGQIRVAVGVGFQKRALDDEVISGSASIMHVPSGLFLTGAAGRNKSGSDGAVSVSLGDFGPALALRVPVDEIDQWAVRIGFSAKINSLGKTKLYGGYSEITAKGVGNVAGVGFSPTYYEFGVEQVIESAAMDLYVVYRNGETNQDKAGLGDSENFEHVVGGMKIRF